MVYLRYIGGGHLPNVPARNLSKEEAKRYGENALLKSGLYVKANKVKPAPRENKIARGGSQNKEKE